MAYLLALDQGTSSSRAIVFTVDGRIVSSAQQEIRQIYPQPGWVEHDPMELWTTQLQVCRDALAAAQLRADQIAGIGITNQRETTVVWNRHTGVPVHNAIVWQDRRTEGMCAELRERGLEPDIHRKTGLVVDPYFSAVKLKWILANVPGARESAQAGDLLFGTVDSWLLWKLTGGRLHATDVSNASRTMLWNIHTRAWDAQLLDWLGVPEAMLPTVHPSSHVYGDIDAAHLGSAIVVGGMAGDQQAALFGQACFAPGMAKSTYGTGCFMLMNTGSAAADSANGLITTVTCQAGAQPCYALEGSVFTGGAVVQWLRDGLSVIKQATDIEQLAASVPDAGGVTFVPSFTGLGAPYWNPRAKGAILGLSRGTTAAHIARAALESIAYQCAALLEAMEKDAVTAALTELRVDGGAAQNNLLLQFQADLLGIPVVRPEITETTALGAACLAGLSLGLFDGLDQLGGQWRADRTFLPSIERSTAQRLMEEWHETVNTICLQHADHRR
jgi:glycerol kinase